MKKEFHLPLSIENCKKNSGCITENTTIVMDAGSRWAHSINNTSDSCYSGSGWNSVVCPDNLSCSKNCALEGIEENDWNQIYGVTSDGKSI